MKQLRRSRINYVLGGVCGGIGEYFRIDPTIIRIIFLILMFGFGLSVLVYLIMWLIVPK